MTTVKVGTVYGFTKKDMKVLDEAVAILNKALNDPKFHEKILESKFSSTKDSSATVLHKLLSGADAIDPRKDEELNVDFVMYHRWWSKVIGYVIPGERVIHINRKYFGDPIDCAANILHEALHLIGYGHYSARDHESVPYKVGNIFAEFVS